MTLSLEPIPIEDWPFQVKGIAYGEGVQGLEVLVSSHSRAPSSTQMRSAWKKWQDNRGVPLLVIVEHGGASHLCGPTTDDPPVYSNLDPGQVERLCIDALEQPSRQMALTALRDSLGALEDEDLVGIRNEGFLASHQLTSGVPKRGDWATAGEKARQVIQQRGKELLSSLGFEIDPLDNITEVLRIGAHKTAVAILLTERESPETGSERFPANQAPVSYALQKAEEENLDWVILLHGRKIRLYPVEIGMGVGRRGRTETFIECNTHLIEDDLAAYLWLLFSADALKEQGTLLSILEESKDFAGDLADRLRERIYDEVVPRLAEGLAEARRIKNPTAQQLDETYKMSMRILFRLLFIAYGEDKDLLPYRYNGLYQKRSLKTKAKELLDLWNSETEFGKEDGWWQEICAICRAVDKGNKSWGVPAYNGGLFSSDPKEHPLGAALEEVSLPDHVLGPALQHLLLVPTAEGVMGPVDFRSLGVREFGTIYEGLLESELSVAESDLTIVSRGKLKDAYRPCEEGEEARVLKGRVYLHNASGARKSSGSYYTKQFAVDHLLDRSLEPALDDHFARLDQLDELEAAETLFDFRVADIAMGSGHFLVAAVDRIEARFASYLGRRSLPHVRQELDHMRKAAAEALGDAADSYPPLEDNALLRRLIARRCIYGVDINEVAVQLARLAIWIHTFVPGLPLSLLDRNLVHGNSLVGIGQLEEIEEVLKEQKLWGWFGNLEDWLGKAKEPLSRLAMIADSTSAEVASAKQAWKEAEKAVAPLAALCKIVTQHRIEGGVLFKHAKTQWKDNPESLLGITEFENAVKNLRDMKDLHFPIAFPEVFLRERAGFDVILGNPPWKEATLEEDSFWQRHYPGLRAQDQATQEKLKSTYRETRPDLVDEYAKEVEIVTDLRRALLSGGYAGMGKGDPDVYKAFCWRFQRLVARGGQIGVVLPRSVFNTHGSASWRQTALLSSDLTIYVLRNTSGWLFDEVNPGYTMCLVNLSGVSLVNEPSVTFSGMIQSLDALIASYSNCLPSIHTKILKESDPLMPVPSFESHDSAELYVQFLDLPTLGAPSRPDFQVVPKDDLHASNARKAQIIGAQGKVPVYNHLNIGHFSFSPEEGIFLKTDFEQACEYLHDKRIRSYRRVDSPFRHMEHAWCEDPDTLPARHPRVAFRDVIHASNPRKVWAALVPANVHLTNKAPYLLFSRGNTKAQAFLLAILNSSPCDWFGHLRIGLNLNYFILNAFPIPEFQKDCPRCRRLVELAALAATQGNGEYGEWDSLRIANNEFDREQVYAEVDGIASLLFGIPDHLMGVVWNDESPLRPPLERVIHYRSIWLGTSR